MERVRREPRPGCRATIGGVLTPPEIVLFDADGVLQLPRAGWRELLAGFSGTDDPAKREAFLADVFAAEAPTQTGAYDFRDALAGVLRRWGSNADVDDALRPWTTIDVDADVLEVVGALRAQGTRCYLATNQQNVRAAYMRSALGLDRWFDAQFYSSEMGLAKPDPAYFTAIVRTVGVPAEYAFFVDDRADNVDGARRAGLRAEVFDLGSGVDALRALLASEGLVV